MKELYLLPEEKRRLLGGLTASIAPNFEFGSVHEVSASLRAEAETVSARGDLTKGTASVTLSFLNDEVWFEGIGGDRQLRLDRVTVRNAGGAIVATRELENSTSAGGCEWNAPEDDHFALYCTGSVEVEFDVPADGRHDVEVVVWAYQYGDELAKLEIVVGSDPERSVGGRAVKAKLAELHEKMLGVDVDESTADVQVAFELFVDAWTGGRASDEGGDFPGRHCDYQSDAHYFDGILEDIWTTDEHGHPVWDWDSVHAHMDTVDWSDPHHVARTWVVVLAYLMTDPRYLRL